MKTYKIVIIGVFVTLLAACRSSRHAQKQEDGVSGSGKTEVVKPEKIRKNTEVTALQAKMDMTLRQGKKSINLSGTYRVKRGEVVQLNLVYSVLFVSVNVGTLELTPDHILVVDRIGKRYCKVAYDEVPQLRQNSIGFSDMEALFWGDKGDVKGKSVSCTYSAWTKLSQGKFPSAMNLMLKMGQKEGKADIKLNNFRETDKWDFPTEPGSNYQRVSLSTVMNALMNAAV